MILVATGINTDVDGKTVTLTPMINGNPALATNPSAGGNMGTGPNGWRCGSATDGTTLPSVAEPQRQDRKSTRLNSSPPILPYPLLCFQKKNTHKTSGRTSHSSPRTSLLRLVRL